LQLAPDYAEALNNLGIVLFQQGKHQQAAERFRGALRVNPGNQEARENLMKVEPFVRGNRSVTAR
jgi:Flp pilus assembly protein TadD